MEIKVRRNAVRTFELGIVFWSEGRRWMLIEREPERDGFGDKLILKKMTAEEEAVLEVMTD